MKKAPSPYITPGILRKTLSKERVNSILAAYGKLWFLHALLDIICKQQDITKLEVFSISRKPDIVFARHLLRFYGWELLRHQVAITDIARFVTNGRNIDHSMVIKSKNLVLDTLNQNTEWGRKLRNAIENIDFKLNQISIDESNSTDRKGR